MPLFRRIVYSEQSSLFSWKTEESIKNTSNDHFTSEKTQIRIIIWRYTTFYDIFSLSFKGFSRVFKEWRVPFYKNTLWGKKRFKTYYILLLVFLLFAYRQKLKTRQGNDKPKKNWYQGKSLEFTFLFHICIIELIYKCIRKLYITYFHDFEFSSLS